MLENTPELPEGRRVKKSLLSIAESTYGRKKCFPCKTGFFSAGSYGEECKQWTK